MFVAAWFLLVLLYFCVVSCCYYCICALNSGYCFVLVEVLKLIRNERKVFSVLFTKREFFLSLFGFRYSGTATDGLSKTRSTRVMVCHMSLIASIVCLLWSLCSHLLGYVFGCYLSSRRWCFDCLVLEIDLFSTSSLTWFFFWTSKFTYLHMCVLWFCFLMICFDFQYLYIIWISSIFFWF